MKMNKTTTKLLQTIPVLILLAVPVVVTNNYVLNVLIMAGIWTLLASSLNIMIGLVGQLSMGHAAFYGIGAYISGLLSVRLGIPIWLGMPAAGLATTFLGYLIGKLTFRVRGSAFVLVTLGLGEVMRLVTNNWMSLTNGPLGLQGISPVKLFGVNFTYKYYYYFILLLVLLVSYIIWRIKNSRFGRAFIAMNENEPLANAVAIHSERFLVLAFMISTCIAGIAGSFYAHYVTFISPDLFLLSNTVTIVVMVIVGGKGTVLGPIVGAIIFTLLPEWLRAIDNYRMLIYGLILMFSILFMKRGIVPSFARIIKKKRGALHEYS